LLISNMYRVRFLKQPYNGGIIVYHRNNLHDRK
jgi:hypothetical protein